jgi:hypothetical protein
MNHFVTKLNKKLIFQLQKIDLEETELLKKALESISCVESALNELRSFLLNHTFKSDDEEIQFFKEIKPGIFSQLIYYVKVSNIESKRPIGSIESQQDYFRRELEELTLFFNNHLEFYGYYRMKSTFLDNKYFVRRSKNIHLHLDNLIVFTEPEFSTNKDYMVAEIIANDRLEVYLKTELDTLTLKANNPNWGQLGMVGNTTLEWTDDKTSLVELIYAINAMGSLNHGKCEISVLTTFFEQGFNIKLTDVYRIYVDIKDRDMPAKYIDKMKAALLHKTGAKSLKIIPLTLLLQSSIEFFY